MLNRTVKVAENELSEQLIGVSGKIKEIRNTDKGTVYRVALENVYYGNAWFYQNELKTDQ